MTVMPVTGRTWLQHICHHAAASGCLQVGDMLPALDKNAPWRLPYLGVLPSMPSHTQAYKRNPPF